VFSIKCRISANLHLSSLVDAVWGVTANNKRTFAFISSSALVLPRNRCTFAFIPIFEKNHDPAVAVWDENRGDPLWRKKGGVSSPGEVLLENIQHIYGSWSNLEE
jgi:hypothetical protein